MLLDLRSIAFPDTQFRASFAQPLKGSGVNLCGQQGPAPPHTRVAYLWASRIPNAVHAGHSTSATPISSHRPEDTGSGGRARAGVEISGSRAGMGAWSTRNTRRPRFTS